MSQGTEAEARPAATQPMQHGHRPAASAQVPATLVPEAGWHFLHLFYRVDRAALAALPESARQRGREELVHVLDKANQPTIEQLQGFATVGHKADFGVVLAGPDLKAVHGSAEEHY